MTLTTVNYDIRALTSSEDDFGKIWQMWQTVFPKWPIEQERLQKLLYALAGYHHLHDNGFCISYMLDGENGKIAAIGVLPEHRGNGLGTALLEKAKATLKNAAEENGGELKSLTIGTVTPRFWPGIPKDFPQETKDFFLHRGFRPSAGSSPRDYFKDIRTNLVSPEVLERVSKSKYKFSPWSAELYEECMAKQRKLFTWSQGYEVLGAYGQHHEAMVAFDPETNAQVGWALMCSPTAIVSDVYAFLPVAPTKGKTGLIAAVGVDEDARGKGIGLAMLVKAMESLKERGCEGIFIDMVTLKDFYEKLGFEILWEYETYVSE